MLTTAPAAPHGQYRVTIPFSPDELAAVDETVEVLLADAGIDGPPVDAFLLAKRLRLAVGRDDFQEGRARCVRLQGRRGRAPAVAALLREDPRPERNQWALAHEIAEQAVCRVYERLGIRPGETPPGRREAFANCMAGRLLVPSRWFLEDGRASDWDVFALKSLYPTASHELLARRMLTCPPTIVVAVHDHGRLTWRQSNAGYLPRLSPDETTARRIAHESTLPFTEGSATSWPIHEPGWKREITRTWLADAFS